MPRSSRLEESQITPLLSALPHWKRKEEEISRTFKLHDFKKAMDFVNRVAELAEAAQHHPDITIKWNQVTLVLSTHSKGGLTQMDFDLASQIDGLIPNFC